MWATIVVWWVFSCMVLGPITGWQALRAGRRPWPWAVAGGLLPVVGTLGVLLLPARSLPTAAQLHESVWPKLGLYMLCALLCVLMLLAFFFAFASQTVSPFTGR